MSSTRGMIYILAIGLLVWGLFLGNPFVNTFATADIYTYLIAAGSEAAWATLFVISGSLMLVGVSTKSVGTLRAGAMMGFLVWIVVTILYAFGNSAATAIVTNGIIATMHGWLYLQARLSPEAMATSMKVVEIDGVAIEPKVIPVIEDKGEV